MEPAVQLGARPRVCCRHGPEELSRAVVAVDVHAIQLGKREAAIAVAADDGATDLVGIPEGRWHERAVVAAGRRIEAERTLHPGPPEVEAPRSARRDDVDLLVLVLSDVGDEQGTGPAVDAETPGVSQARGPDLRP